MSVFLDTRGRPSLAIAICDRCSRKFPIDQLSPDGNSPGLRVCAVDNDMYDPWRLPARSPDQISLRYPRPDSPLDIPALLASEESPTDMATYYASLNGIDPSQAFICLVGDSKMFLLTQNGGFNPRMEELTAVGGQFEGLYGWANFGASGYTLNGFVTDGPSPGWVNPTPSNPDWNWRGIKTGAYVNTQTSMADLITFLGTLDEHIRPIVCLGHEFNDFALYAANGNLSAEGQVDYLLERLRIAVEGIKAARDNVVIMLTIPHYMLPRPYTGVIPSASAYPTFGTDLSADTAKLTVWNNSFDVAKRQVAAEYGYTAVWDWREVTGDVDIATTTPSTCPYYVDNAHEHYTGASYLADDFVQVITGDIWNPSTVRAKLADAIAAIDSSYAIANYPAYCQVRTATFQLVAEGGWGAAGPTYMDVGVSSSALQTAVAGAARIYFQVGDAAGQVFTSIGTPVVLTSSSCRILGVSPSAAMQATASGLQLRVYVERSIATGDAYIDGLTSQFSTYSHAYIGGIASAGAGYIDVSFDAVDRLPTMSAVQQGLRNLKLAVGSGNNVLEDMNNWEPSAVTGTQIRLLRGGTWTAYDGARVALLIPLGIPDPKSREAEASRWIVSTVGIGLRQSDQILVDTTSGASTFYMPTAPVAGAGSITIRDAAGTFAANPCTLDRGGKTIRGAASNLVLNTNWSTTVLSWNGTTWSY